MLQTRNIMKESNQLARSVIHSVIAAYHSEMKENNKIRHVTENPSNILTGDREYIYNEMAVNN